MTIVVTLRRFRALADCVLTDSFGRRYTIKRGYGGHFDPAGAAPLVKAGLLEEVPERRNPPGGWDLPWSDERRAP